MIKPAFPSLFTYKVIEIPDENHINIKQYFPECNAFIDNALSNGGRVLVHCAAGVSRSASVVIAYVMYKKGFGFVDAY